MDGRYVSGPIEELLHLLLDCMEALRGVAGQQGILELPRTFRWSVELLGFDGAIGRQGLERIQRDQVRMHCSMSGLL